jgi:hypothetical protein
MAMQVPTDESGRRNVTDQDITVPTHDALPAIALAVLAVAFFAAGIALLVFAFWSTWTFWPRVGLGFAGSYALACAVALIATRSGEIVSEPHGMRHAAIG